MIINADVLKFAAEYEGDLFSGILADPPYHLTDPRSAKRGYPARNASGEWDNAGRIEAQGGKGFMGQQWDGGDIAFRPETWAAFLPLLHDGAICMAFAGTRGYHRMATAIEDAGYILHPMLVWCFGCLSEDTEILTKEGWEPYQKAIQGTDVLCYNNSENTFSFQPVEELYVYDYNEIAYRIHSERTDQLVSRNHRCLVKRANGFEFVCAEKLQSKETVPILASVSGLLESLCRDGLETVLQENNLRSTLREPSHRNQSEGQKSQANSRTKRKRYNLPAMRQSDLEIQRSTEKIGGRVLFQIVPSQTRNYPFANQEQIRQNGHEVSQLRIKGRVKSCLEGWSNVFSEAWKLFRCEVRSLSEGLSRNGTKRRLCYGASAFRGTSDGALPFAFGSGSPCQSRSDRQPHRESATVCNEPSPQTIRASRHTISDLATVTPVHYQGKVWCVRVPTGAFVARRNGRIFVTGNSGFPKATRILGKEYEETGETQKGAGSAGNVMQTGLVKTYSHSLPATDLAKAFAGHRYGLQALKPSLEPICVFQKPYRGKPVDSIIRTGAGSFNIDASRIGTSEKLGRPQSEQHFFKGLANNTYNDNSNGGRWTSNLLLDSESADMMDRQSGQLTSGKLSAGHKRGDSLNIPFGGGGTIRGNYGGDTGGASRYFFASDWDAEEHDPLYYCAKAGRRERDSGLDGMPQMMKLRDDLTEEDRAYVMSELERCGVSL